MSLVAGRMPGARTAKARLASLAESTREHLRWPVIEHNETCDEQRS
jgi:hypothetical protein